MKNRLNKGAILIISGPSGCGKSSLLKELYKKIDNYYFSISTTTRMPRENEKNGVDYIFVSKEEFQKDIEHNNFLEYAKVHDNYYGTSLKPILNSIKKNMLVIFDIDTQGHNIIKKKMGDIATSVFITTPTLKELKHRLYLRKTDTKSSITKRIKNAKQEIQYIKEYDYLIINDDLKKAAKELVSIAKIAKLKTKLFNKKNIAKYWLK